MGAGLITQTAIPEKAVALSLMSEYDKLRGAGLDSNEIYHIYKLRSTVNEINAFTGLDSSGQKDDSIRITETTNTTANDNKQVEMTKKTSDSKLSQNELKIRKPLALLVDDSPVASKLASRVLQSVNFDVLTTHSAESGMEVLRLNSKLISIVFLDVVMPNVDGVECLSWIKADPSLSHIPIYMLSGLDDETLSEVCVENGAEGMLLKPLNVPILKEIIDTHGLTATTLPPSQLRIDTDIRSPKNLVLSSKSQLSSVINNTPLVNNTTDIKIDAAIDENREKSVDSSNLNRINDSINNLMSPFRLVDSNFKQFIYPSPSLISNILFTFIPTIFFKELYDQSSSPLRWLLSMNDLLKSKDVSVVVISGDLPMALSAGKSRFKLPYTFLADPSLHICKKYVGTFKLTHYFNNAIATAKGGCKKSPHLGLILVDRESRIIKEWIAMNPDGTPNPRASLPDIKDWVNSLDSNNSGSNYKNGPMKQSQKFRVCQSTPVSPVSRAQFSPEAAVPDDVDNKRKFILVVDDSSISSRTVTRKLERRGFAVRSTYNGVLALDMLRKEPSRYALVITDVVMATMDGMEFLSHLKADEMLSSILVVMLTNLESVDTHQICLQTGALAVFKKPLDEELLHDLLIEHDAVKHLISFSQ